MPVLYMNNLWFGAPVGKIIAASLFHQGFYLLLICSFYPAC